jgi:ParB/RepB/Spo0J family partition protein
MATGNTSALSSTQTIQAVPSALSEVQMLLVSEIFLDESRPKTCAEIDAMRDSIRERGFDAPVTVRKKKGDHTFQRYEIVDGMARRICAVALGIKTVPAVIVQMSDEQARRYREKQYLAKVLFVHLRHPKYVM